MKSKFFVSMLSLLLLTNCGTEKSKKSDPPPSTQPPTTQTTDQPPANANEYKQLQSDFNTYVQKQEATYYGEADVTWNVNVTAMRKAGYSETTIKEVLEVYGEIRFNKQVRQTYASDGGEYTYGKIKVAVKAVRWITKNWNTILNRMPPKVKSIAVKWIKIEIFTGLLDKYLGFSDKIEEVLTNALNEIFPWWLEWATPALVFVITFAIPVL